MYAVTSDRRKEEKLTLLKNINLLNKFYSYMEKDPNKIVIENYFSHSDISDMNSSLRQKNWVPHSAQTNSGSLVIPDKSEESTGRRRMNSSIADSLDSERSDRDFQDESADGKKGLNWKQYLKDEKVSIESLKFEQHRAVYMKEDPAITKDLPRTRPDDPFFQKDMNIKALREIACFYCNANHFYYQQGLLDIVVPFLKLRNPKFRTKDCYAYFSSFMRNYFPNILSPTLMQDVKELPHLNAAINFCGVLIEYHLNKVMNILRESQLDLRTFITPWVMTIFTKGTTMPLVYELFDKYMAERDKLFLFYMVVAILKLNEKKIIEVYESKDEVMFITFMNRTLKEEFISSSENVELLFESARVVKSKTPTSFAVTLRQMGLMSVEILSMQEFNEFLQHKNDQSMEMYPFELVDYLAFKPNEDMKSSFHNSEMIIKILDCRKEKDNKYLPFTMDIPSKCYKEPDLLKFYIKQYCENEKETHFAILKTNDKSKEEEAFIQKVLLLCRSHNKNYVSVVVGGFEGIMKEIKQRRIEIPIYKKHKTTIFDKIKGLWRK